MPIVEKKSDHIEKKIVTKKEITGNSIHNPRQAQGTGDAPWH